MTNTKKDERIGYIDIARGIAILLVIIGHVLYKTTIGNFIFSFHMPLFLIISGMLFKYNSNTKYFIIKITKRLLIPYILGVTFVNISRNILLDENIKIIPQILGGFSNRNSLFTGIETVGVLWFFPYLICIQSIYNWLNYLAEGNDYFLAYECIIFMLCGFYFSVSMVYLPWSIDIAITTIIFYYLGNMLIKHNFLEKILSNIKIILLFLIIWLLGVRFLDLEFAHRQYSIFSFITSFAGSILALKISTIIDKYFKFIKKFLIWCGRNTIPILIFHYFEYKIFEYTGSDILVIFQKIIFVIIMTFILNTLISLAKKIKNKIKHLN